MALKRSVLLSLKPVKTFTESKMSESHSEVCEIDNELEISIAGNTASGKSTVLVLVAQYLNSLGYTVGVPKHLIGLGVNVDLLREQQCKSTLIKLRELNEG
jgi:Tfp pilus assembly pilus retraction ATPase PilT